ncbi:DinB family protein [Pseudonocardia sp. ICBG1293]|uniref:DinB family protein n=1 Tax=Pseudonocardia sp. ICBG1293 TaxID=2844382 RepID=UPI001CCD9793|nr:DinB family protein [Pseudonocardia sp. ICBG1293]
MNATDEKQVLTGERAELVATLERHRGFLLQTADGLTEQQARTRSTVSALTIASLLKHVADTEEQWFRFAVEGAAAFGEVDVYNDSVDWDAETDANGGDWSASGGEWVDTRFVLADHETLEHLRTRVEQVAARTEEVLRSADLDATHALPVAPWFEPNTSWSVRRVTIHMLAEISQHAGHADIIREAIDGARTMG